MADDVARLDILWAPAPPGRFPGCGFRELVAVTDGEQTAFMCQSCGQCWQVELGWAHRVDRRNLLRASAQPHRADAPAAGRCDPAAQAEHEDSSPHRQVRR